MQADKNRNFQPSMFALLLSVCAFALAGSSALARDKIHFVTEPYAPYNYAENGQLMGLSVDLVNGMMSGLDVDYDMEIMPWARAISLAESQTHYCVFTTVHTPERDKHFKWVEPLVTARNYLTKKKGSDVMADTLEEARKYLIGSQRGDYTVEILESKGFDRLDITSEIDLTLNKLLKGRIDLMPMADGMIREKQAQGIDVEPMIILTTSINAIACNIQTPNTLIKAMQDRLDQMTVDGTKEEIFRKFGFPKESF